MQASLHVTGQVSDSLRDSTDSDTSDEALCKSSVGDL